MKPNITEKDLYTSSGSSVRLPDTAMQEQKPSLFRRPIYSFNVTEENQIKDKAKLKLSDFAYGFSTTTGLHGLPNCYNATSYIKKLLWTGATLAMLGVCIYNVAQNVQTLLSWDVTVSVDITSVRELPFPAVTICNLNSLKLSAIPADLLSKLQNSALTSSVQDQGPGGFGDNTGLGTTKSTKLSTQEVITEELIKYPLSDRISYGYGLKDFVLSCSYSGYDCLNAQQWEQVYNWKYGNCYVFNVNASLTRLTSQRSGPNYGLTVVLHTDTAEYVPMLSDMVGARIDIHDAVDMPFPEEVGVNVSPGTSTGIGLRKVDISRLGGKYTTCRDSSVQSYEDNVYEEIYTWTNYSLTACQKTCWQKMVIQDCDCFDANYPSQGTAFTSSQTSPCSSFNSTQSMCKETTQTKYLSDTSCPECTVSCNQTSYGTTISTSVWPASTYKQTLLSSLDQSSTSVQNLINGTVSLSENLMQVEIYFEELNYEAITESAAYTEAMFMSDLGGAFGLWLGASVLCVVELVELLMDVIGFLIYKACRRSNKTQAMDSS